MWTRAPSEPTLPFTRPIASRGPAEDLTGYCVDGKYTLREPIAQGSYGRVYRAERSVRAPLVAVKVLHADLARSPRHVECFLAEAVIATRVRHPNVVSVLDHGVSEHGLVYIVMELIEGPTLTELIRRAFPLPGAKVVELMVQLLDGLAAVHAQGIVHADIKTDNILVNERADRDLVTIVDFGIARRPEPGDRERAPANQCVATAHLSVVHGTPGYVAPEVIRGDAPRRSCDIYASGVVLYQLLTGRRPYAGKTPIEVLRRQLDDPVPTPSELIPALSVPADLERALLRALARDPTARYPTIRAFRETIEATAAARGPGEACAPSNAVATR